MHQGKCGDFTNRNATADPKNWWNPEKHVRILGSPFHQQESNFTNRKLSSKIRTFLGLPIAFCVFLRKNSRAPISPTGIVLKNTYLSGAPYCILRIFTHERRIPPTVAFLLVKSGLVPARFSPTGMPLLTQRIGGIRKNT